jgi:hypothetical protein
MNFNPDTTRAMAHERFRDFERNADDGLLDEARSHTSLVSRMRERMPFVHPRDRRALRAARDAG